MTNDEIEAEANRFLNECRDLATCLGLVCRKRHPGYPPDVVHLTTKGARVLAVLADLVVSGPEDEPHADLIVKRALETAFGGAPVAGCWPKNERST